MQQSQELCDVILVVGGREFPAHRLILFSASDYFKTLFDEKYIEGSQKHVTINDFEADTMSVVLDYIYSGRLQVNNENVAEILRLCDYFGMENAKNICRDYLIDNINENNWVQNYILGEIYELSKLHNRAKTEITTNLGQAVQNKEFSELSFKHIEDILAASLESCNIEVIYKVIIKWVKHDLENRKGFLRKLLGILPIKDISLEFFISNIKHESILRDDVECNNWLIEALYEKCNNILVHSDWLDSSVFVTNRLGEDLTTYKCNIGSLEVHKLAAKPDLSFYTSTYYQNAIYMTGGVLGERAIPNKTSYKYNRIENSWSQTNFKCAKTYAGSAVLNDLWYVVGGIDLFSDKVTKTVDVYDFNTGKASTVKAMEFTKRQPGLVSYYGSLFSCCGYDGRLDNRMVERFDPREGRWELVYSYLALDGACTATVIDDYLYCMRYFSSFTERLDFRCYKSEIIPYETICEDGQWMTSVGRRLVVGHKKGVVVNKGNNWEEIASMNLLEPIVISNC